jgi:inhibitor of cysteine peptidase
MTAGSCIDETANGQQRDFALGQAFEICLPENPTTGYRWQLDTAANSICVLEQDRFEAPDGPPGQGGRHRWQFRAAQAGRATIDFSYRRAWAGAGPPTKTFALRVRVRP